MKKTIQELSIALALLLPLAATAQVNYVVSGDTAYVTNSPSASGNIVIASTYDGYPVTSIGYLAFENCAATNITIPNSVTTIGTEVFFGCRDLPNVTIPNSVTNMDFAFLSCYGLTNITVAADNPAYTSLGGVLFNKDATTLLQYPESLVNSNYSIPNSVTSIEDQAFSYSSRLTTVTIPDSVTTIAENAFGWGSLTSVTIPNSVTNLGYAAFQQCGSLTNIVLSTNVATIGVGEFADCFALRTIVIPNGVVNIDDQAFNSCVDLTSVSIADSVTNIGVTAFYICRSLKSVVIPNSVTSIGTNAFGNCWSLTSVTIGSGVTNIESDAFQGCSALISVDCQGNAPMADSTVFLNDTNLTVYYAPDTTGWNAFASTVGVVTAPEFGSAAYGGSPTFFYPPSGTNNTLETSTNPASGIWVTVSNAVTLAALQLTNPPPSAFFLLQSSGGRPPNAGLGFYGSLPVLFYPTNAAYSLLMSTSVTAPNWTAPPGGNAFITVQVTNAPPDAVFRLH